MKRLLKLGGAVVLVVAGAEYVAQGREWRKMYDFLEARGVDPLDVIGPAPWWDFGGRLP